MLFGLNQVHLAEDFDGHEAYEGDIELGDISIHVCGADPARVALMLIALEEYVDAYPSYEELYH